MGKAKKLPSGAWRIQVYDYTDNSGKRHYRSFSANTKKGAEYLASDFKFHKERIVRNEMPFTDALNMYIEQRSKILSPNTIREYKRACNNDFNRFGRLNIDKITQNDIQKFINEYASNHSPKTTRNIHGIITAVLSAYRPELRVKTDLPKKISYQREIPSERDIRSLIECVENTDMEVPILLAAFGSMRRGEISAIKYEDINKNTLHVHKSMAYTGTKWIEKSPKTLSSDRFIELPYSVIKKIGKGSGYIVDLNPTMITARFNHVCKKAGIHHFRFHDLRHYCASFLHAMGVPDIYIMQRGGWSSDTVLKSVYRHALPEETKKVNKQINHYFEELTS